MRAYVYQARNLPPIDASGLASTYVTVSIAGKTGRLAHTQPARYKEFKEYKDANQNVMNRTTTAKNTLHPIWYETLLIEKLNLPAKLSFAPDIEVRVYAQGNDEFIGLCFYIIIPNPLWFLTNWIFLLLQVVPASLRILPQRSMFYFLFPLSMLSFSVS